MTNLMPSKKDRPSNSAHLQFHLRRGRRKSRIAPRAPSSSPIVTLKAARREPAIIDPRRRPPCSSSTARVCQVRTDAFACNIDRAWVPLKAQSRLRPWQVDELH